MSRRFIRVSILLLAAISITPSLVRAEIRNPGNASLRIPEAQVGFAGDLDLKAIYSSSNRDDYFGDDFQLVENGLTLEAGFSPVDYLWIYLSGHTNMGAAPKDHPRLRLSQKLTGGFSAGYDFKVAALTAFAEVERLEEPHNDPYVISYSGALSYRLGVSAAFRLDSRRDWRLNFSGGYYFDNTDNAISPGDRASLSPADQNSWSVRGDWRPFFGAGIVGDLDPVTLFAEAYGEYSAGYQNYGKYDSAWEEVDFIQNPLYAGAGLSVKADDFISFTLAGEVGISDRVKVSTGADIAVVPLWRATAGMTIFIRAEREEEEIEEEPEVEEEEPQDTSETDDEAASAETSPDEIDEAYSESTTAAQSSEEPAAAAGENDSESSAISTDDETGAVSDDAATDDGSIDQAPDETEGAPVNEDASPESDVIDGGSTGSKTDEAVPGEADPADDRQE